jgi:hypothetical protein
VRTLFALLALVLFGGIAEAAPRKILVFHAEGTVDAATRARVDAAVLALAQKLDGEVSLGGITFSDATAAVGCAGDVNACGDQVLETLAVDELVVVQVASAGSGTIRVTISRVDRTATREKTADTLAKSPDPALAEAVGSLFGIAPPRPSEPTRLPAPAEPTPATTPPPGPSEPIATPAPLEPPAAAAPAVTAAPENIVRAPEGGRRTSRLAIARLAGGGALMLAGVLLWSTASVKQARINDAPTRTHDDLVQLAALESDADAFALWGNVTFVTGVALAGVGGYLVWRGQPATGSRQARIVPVVFDHGAGLTLTLGGAP